MCLYRPSDENRPSVYVSREGKVSGRGRHQDHGTFGAEVQAEPAEGSGSDRWETATGVGVGEGAAFGAGDEAVEAVADV